MNRNQIYFVLENENHKTASLPDSNIKKKVLIDVTRWWGSFMKDQKMLAWMLIFILSLLGVTFPPPPLCDALIKMVTLLLLVYVPLSFSWFLSLSLVSQSLSAGVLSSTLPISFRNSPPFTSNEPSFWQKRGKSQRTISTTSADSSSL